MHPYTLMAWLSAGAALLVLAMWCDVQSHRIPNPLVGAGLLMGAGLSLFDGGLGWRESLLAATAGIAAFLPLYLLRILGAGDVKLMGAVGSFVGYPGVLSVALLTALAGAVLAVLIAIRQRRLRSMVQQMGMGLLGLFYQVTSGGRPRQWVMVVGPHRMPYACAIGMGTVSHFFMNH